MPLYHLCRKVVSKIEPDELPEDLSKIASTLLEDPTTSTTVRLTRHRCAAALYRRNPWIALCLLWVATAAPALPSQRAAVL
jgi:hypothetical protein